MLVERKSPTFRLAPRSGAEHRAVARATPWEAQDGRIAGERQLPIVHVLSMEKRIAITTVLVEGVLHLDDLTHDRHLPQGDPAALDAARRVLPQAPPLQCACSKPAGGRDGAATMAAREARSKSNPCSAAEDLGPGVNRAAAPLEMPSSSPPSSAERARDE